VVGKVQDHHFKHLKQYYKTLSDLYESDIVDFASITCFSDIDAGATTKHHDDGDVFNLQCIGNVKWEIWDEPVYSQRPPDQVFYQEPGDIIYVPAYVFHRVTSLTPRASLLFGFNQKQ
jgi:ribosomal protein L16 Arg81 hydroxylase